ncbi:MAG: hypothetical protein WAO35_06845 [Terriglobia bacterium]
MELRGLSSARAVVLRRVASWASSCGRNPKKEEPRSFRNAKRRATWYVEWHLRPAWAPLLFEDEQRREERKRRDPISPAEPSAAAQAKKSSQQTADALPVQSFATLLAELASRGRVTYEIKSRDVKVTCQQVPEPTPWQKRAYELTRAFPVTGN